jgi:hypothetical protein
MLRTLLVSYRMWHWSYVYPLAGLYFRIKGDVWPIIMHVPMPEGNKAPGMFSALRDQALNPGNN